MDIRRQDCIDAYRRIGMREPERFFGEYSQQGPFMLLEEGKMSVGEFHTAMRAEFDSQVTDSEIDAAFCAFLTGIPVHRLEALRELRKRYKIYLLSNTNEIMWQSKIADEFRKEGREREDYFDGIVTSFEAKALKPDARIFDFACRKLDIRPDETLFVDDSRSNLDAAAALGFKTLLAAPGSEFAQTIAALGL